MNEPVYLGLSTLQISKSLMYEFWHDYVRSKYQLMPHYSTWTQIAFSCILELKMFMKTLQMMLKKILSLNYAIKSPLPIGKN